jgi:hypothetical protein
MDDSAKTFSAQAITQYIVVQGTFRTHTKLSICGTSFAACVEILSAKKVPGGRANQSLDGWGWGIFLAAVKAMNNAARRSNAARK